jgi:hypothetical protein
MFSNTITWIIGGVTKTLIKINQDNYASEYLLRETLESYRLRIRHTVAKRTGGFEVDRHQVEAVHTVFATITVPELVRKVYLVFEQDKTDTMVNDVKALSDWLIVSSNVNTVSLANWES